jgi:SCY1-like protein 2
MVDASLRSLPIIITATDFTTVKNELFPRIAAVFTKTSSLGIKVRGLEAFTVLCGGSPAKGPDDDGLTGAATEKKTTKTTSVLDRFTIQEKVIPLLRAIKTKEPAVMVSSEPRT